MLVSKYLQCCKLETVSVSKIVSSVSSSCWFVLFDNADSVFEDRGRVTLSTQESTLVTFLWGLLIKTEQKTFSVPNLRLKVSPKLF